MRILLTNDDGIQAEGLRALYVELSKSHDCTVIAPDGERSACSHSLTIHRDLFYEKTDLGYAVSGSPADCVKMGILHIMGKAPDLVISGINNGPNLGSDVMYSGTVSAAKEAAYLNIKGIAVSLSSHNASSEFYEKAAKLLAEKLTEFTALPIDTQTVLNVNYPVKAPFKGVKYTKAGINIYNDTYVSVVDNACVRLKGVAVRHDKNDDDCDVELIKKGYATVTPLMLDSNDYKALMLIQNARR